MAEERKPLTIFQMARTLNGGWCIYCGDGDYGRRQETYSYSSDRDMLAALPGLIGCGETMAIIPLQEAINRQRDNAVEATKADIDEYRKCFRHRDPTTNYGVYVSPCGVEYDMNPGARP